ncbi:MAG TPA: hypothetical protein VFP68_16590 [Burkholderiaceae bacterium]|nr:hypothetical protein [Burkholderiaceae bacterium]
MDSLDRSALGIRIIAALELQGRHVVPLDDRLLDQRNHLLRMARLGADAIAVSRGLGVAGHLAQLIEAIEKAVADEAHERSVCGLDEACRALLARLGRRSCSFCTRSTGSQPLCADLGEWASPDPPGVCIDELVSLLFSMREIARALYARHTPRANDIVVSYSLQGVSQGAERGFIPEFHLNGSTRVDADRTTIGIDLENEALDLPTLFQLAYVCAHELICHAFQSILGPERQNVGPTCSWSEGWMDTVAWLLLQRWVNTGDQGLPQWMTAVPDRALDDCRRLHERRYEGRQGPAMPPHQLMRRVQARDACRRLLRHWSAPDNKRTLKGLRKLVQFSVTLNAASLSRKDRNALIVQLSTGLLAGTPKLLQRTVRACEDFLAHGNPLRFLEELAAGAELIYPRPMV